MKTTKPEEILEAICNPVACAALYQKGLERAVESGNASLDLAVQTNAEIVAIIKKALQGTSLPGLFVLDLAVQAFEGFVSVQKQLMELALQQSVATVAAVQNYKQTPTNDDLANAFQAVIERSVAAQNTVAEYAAKQSKNVSETVKQQPGVAGTPVETIADSVQRSFDTVLGAQRDILNIAVKPLKSMGAHA